MDITERDVKTALVRSGIEGVDFVVNPYLGCGHGCRYCYAAFMTRYSRHHARCRWGTFVEVKRNVVDILRSELSRKRSTGTVLMSSVCDPYQPAESRYGLTRQCIEALGEFGWGIDILTRSPLVARDMDLLSCLSSVSVGITISTDIDRVRKILEPKAPSIESRFDAMKKLHDAGLETWAFIGPMLPMNPRNLYEAIGPYVNNVLIDSLNYQDRVRDIFLKNNWGHALTDRHARETADELIRLFGDRARRVKGR
jgi:DNA repair photolyase